MQANFKSCPFCGSSEIRKDYQSSGHGESISFICCTKCSAQGPSDYYKLDVENSWNYRSIDRELVEKVLRLHAYQPRPIEELITELEQEEK